MPRPTLVHLFFDRSPCRGSGCRINPSDPWAPGPPLHTESVTSAPAAVEDAPDTAGRVPRWAGAVIGLVAAGCGLAVAERLVGVWTSLQSPVLSVGDRVVDNVPRPVKQWAIDTFGTSDKVVLVGGVVVLLALFAAGIGILAARRGERAGLVGVGAFTLVGVAASLGRGSSGPAGIVPSVLAGVVAGAVLVWLVHLARPDSADSVTPMSAMSRRRFLGTAAALTAGAVVLTGAGRWLRQRG